MKKKIYQVPDITISVLEQENVIRTSENEFPWNPSGNGDLGTGGEGGDQQPGTNGGFL